MASLIERLESAERGSPQLSAEVLTALTGFPHSVRYEPATDDTWIDWSDHDAIARGVLDVPLGGSYRLGCGTRGDITESLDAAWAMAEGLGWEVEFTTQRDAEDTRVYEAFIGGRAKSWVCEAYTPALALCVALVRAAGGTDAEA